ncbi:DUF3300 domain-containing protein [Albimonas pacifica]|uniref:DUF3300 domain-containing protein n=1 Tax=Albimonas pacifica TaxID=1114924 RepID=A0A1I3NG41_9RHOB|nr:DUF3300 domain-containing protein [Albimonas pacifica]SFJ08273.1 Protein of unknown function [Albimonas pacifica]
MWDTTALRGTLARLAGAGALAIALAGAPAPGGLRAQSDDPVETAEPEAVAEEDLLSESELDDLAAPVALYPDALLTQVLVATTFPLDVVKAGRWVGDNADLAADARDDAAGGEGWDPSVAALAAGFPSLVTRMSDNLDWTQAMGDAMLTQSDDVLDAVQRLRAQAQDVGNLDSNDAQTVTVEGDEIYIEPTSEEVVYVPAYDAQAVYTQSSGGKTVVYDDGDDGWDSTDMLLTGGIAFGAGMLVNEIFDDDDDWNGYWRPGPPPIRWGGGGFYPRPWAPGRGPTRVNVGNRVNIDVDRDGRWRPDDRRRDDARDRLARRDPGDRPHLGDRNGINRPGGLSGGRSGDRPGGGRPNLESSIQDRLQGGGGDNRPNLGGGGGNRPNLGGGRGNDRPNLGGGGTNRPNLSGGGGNRPSLGGGGASRPTLSGGGGRPASGGGLSHLKNTSSRGGKAAIQAKRPAPSAARPKLPSHKPAGGGLFSGGGNAGTMKKAQNRGAASAGRAKLPVGGSRAARGGGGGGRMGGLRR